MTKLSQLEDIRALKIPTPRFKSITYQRYRTLKVKLDQFHRLRYPLAVRSSFQEEDGEVESNAGAFLSILHIPNEKELYSAIDQVFASYPSAQGQLVIIQEMLEVTYSGVLFAYRDTVWKCEFMEGLGEQVVGGQVNPYSFLLPRFQSRDLFWNRFYSFWQGMEALDGPSSRMLRKIFIKLAIYTQQLLDFYQKKGKARIGLDIEFAIQKGKLFILQARPISTIADAEEVLTSANHKEILPPEPSPMMTSLISASGKSLFAYYQALDPSLSSRDFVISAAEMPWINLSALLDIMVHWGLPSSLVCKSVGAQDFYRVGLRPYRILSKWNVFWKVFWQQNRARREVEKWVVKTQKEIKENIQKRQEQWQDQPDLAFESFWQDLKSWYIGLVERMQGLTGAMSGPLQLAQLLGQVHNLSAFTSKSTDYLQAFQQLIRGDMDKTDFLKLYGHRSFYESDIGQARFEEFKEEEWEAIFAISSKERSPKETGKIPVVAAVLLKPLVRLIHSREYIRHESMKMLRDLRKEMQMAFGQHQKKDWGPATQFSDFKYKDLGAFFRGEDSFLPLHYPPPSGWDMDTFLFSQSGKRTPISYLFNLEANEADQKKGLGIYPGKIKGQVWRVKELDQLNLKKPDFKTTILVTESLDPGWIPYFLQVEGVITFVGGLLSHASIILRESKIPSLTQLPRDQELETGDWIEMDAAQGKVIKLKA